MSVDIDIRKVIPTLKDDEEVNGVYHQLWISYFWHLLGSSALIVAPFFFLYLFLRWGVYGSAFLALVFLAGALWLARTWRLWRYSMLIATSKRLIMVNQLGIFDRKIAQVDFDKILDISHRRTGLLQTLFNYGSVTISPWSDNKIILNDLAKPAFVQESIYDWRESVAKGEVRELSQSELLAIIRDIQERIGKNRWEEIMQGEWELKQELIDEVSEEDEGQAKAIEQFFSARTVKD